MYTRKMSKKKDKEPKSSHSTKLPGASRVDDGKLPRGLLLNNGLPTTNATRLPSVVKKKHVIMQSEKPKGAFAGLLKQEFKPKIKSRSTSKKDRDEFLAEEERRRKHDLIKESSRQTVVKKEEDKKKKDEERKKARLAGSSIKQQDIVTFGFGSSKTAGARNAKGSFMNGRISIKQETEDDVTKFNRKIVSSSRRITDSDDDECDTKKHLLSKLYADDFVHGKHKEVFSTSGPVRLPLVSWTVHRKHSRTGVVAKSAGKCVKKTKRHLNAFADKQLVVRSCRDTNASPVIHSWSELKKLGMFDSADPVKQYVSPVSSGWYLSNSGKDCAKSVTVNPKSSMTTALLKQFLHPARSDIVLMKIPPFPINNLNMKCDATTSAAAGSSDCSPPLTFHSFLKQISQTGGPVGKLQICKSGRAFLCMGNIRLELGFASNVGNIIDLVKFDINQLKTKEIESSREIMGSADCVGNAGFQFVVAPQWSSLYTEHRQ